MHALLAATLPIPAYPPSSDLVKILPELVLSGGFLLLMLLDLVVPATRRSLLAGVAALVLVGGLVTVVVGWFDATTPQSAYNGAFAYDRFSLFVDAIVISAALLVVVISPGYLNRRGLHYGEFYSLIIGATIGMVLLDGAMNLMVIFLGIELLSIALYVLSGFARTEERSQEAGLKYLLLGGFASGFLLYGMALVYGETGHTNLGDIARVLVHSGGEKDPLFLLGVVLMLVGFAFKTSSAPFHLWTPDVYQGAPTAVTTFMSVATKSAAMASLIRVFNYIFAPTFDRWSGFVVFVAVISMVIGNLAALTQQSVKRVLAYSSIAQAGYILIGVAVGPVGTTAALFYLASYTAMNLGAFAVVTVMAGRGEDIDSYASIRGLFYRRPYVAGAMALFLLSLGGFPPTVGFFGKFLVFSAAIQAHSNFLAFVGIVTSAISVFYYLRLGLLLFARPADDEPSYPWARTGAAGGAVLLTTATATLGLGILTFVLYDLSSTAGGNILAAVAR